MKPRFKVSYRGEADYLFEGKEYRVRFFAEDDGHYNGDYYQTGIEPFVGCLSHKHDFHEFPSPAVLEAFQEENPGIVGARYTDERCAKVEYTEPPQTRRKGRTVYAKWHLDMLESVG